MSSYENYRLKWARRMMGPKPDAFTQWMHRPVYVVQCRTSKVARELCNVHVPEGQGHAQRIDGLPTDALSLFRVFRQYRTPEANALRKRVADIMRARRAKPY